MAVSSPGRNSDVLIEKNACKGDGVEPRLSEEKETRPTSGQ